MVISKGLSTPWQVLAGNTRAPELGQPHLPGKWSWSICDCTATLHTWSKSGSIAFVQTGHAKTSWPRTASPSLGQPRSDSDSLNLTFQPRMDSAFSFQLGQPLCQSQKSLDFRFEQPQVNSPKFSPTASFDSNSSLTWYMGGSIASVQTGHSRSSWTRTASEWGRPRPTPCP